jgi:LPXTG-motif cell wall-anchored protein
VRLHRIIGVLIAVAIAVCVTPAAAFATPYPAVPPPSSVSHGTVGKGGTVTFSGRGFLPFEKISITVSFAGSDSSATFRQNPAGGFVPAVARLARRSTLVVIADRDGAFSVEVPLGRIGSATLVATGLTSGRRVTAHVEVLAPANPHPGGPAPGGGGEPGKPIPGGGGEPGGPGGGGEPAHGHSPLPKTGQSGTLLLTIVSSGAAAVLLGGVLVGFARRRRDHTG